VSTLSPDQFRRVLEVVRSLPDQADAAVWDALTSSDWPVLFRLIDLAADLPRLAPNRTLAAWPRDAWPELADVRDDLVRLQEIVDRPAVPRAARPAPEHRLDTLDDAVRELETRHCVHVDFLLDEADRAALDREIDALKADKLGTWGELARDEAPGVYAVFERALGSDRFRRLTGFDLERDPYTLTLSLQDLDDAGIGWHRDLYWPREWVGEDVFAVLYALGGDSPERGGAFLYYVPWENEIYAHYRRRHQATVMWNSADPGGRLLHAVSEYLTNDTARHLIILQCRILQCRRSA
jgi:hypothetical protein